MKFKIFINIFLISPGNIHFWVCDDVTDNSILDLQRKNSICNAFAPPLVCFLSYLRGTCETKKDGVHASVQRRERSAERDANSCDFHAI